MPTLDFWAALAAIIATVALTSLVARRLCGPTRRCEVCKLDACPLAVDKTPASPSSTTA